MHNYSCLNQLTIFAKCSILDVWQSSDYASNYTSRYKIVTILRLEYIKSLYYLLSKHIYLCLHPEKFGYLSFVTMLLLVFLFW